MRPALWFVAVRLPIRQSPETSLISPTALRTAPPAALCTPPPRALTRPGSALRPRSAGRISSSAEQVEHSMVAMFVITEASPPSDGSRQPNSRRRHFREARPVAAGVHPGLGAAAIDLYSRLVRGRIVERASKDDYETWHHIRLCKNARSAVRAKPPPHLLPGLPRIIVGF